MIGASFLAPLGGNAITSHDDGRRLVGRRRSQIPGGVGGSFFARLTSRLRSEKATRDRPALPEGDCFPHLLVVDHEPTGSDLGGDNRA